MCKIVIIEDDIDICNMIKKFLENNKYSVQYALNGIEGINLCKSFVPDLIILDIMLPGLNGDDVLQKLRKFTNAPVIVVSAKTMVQTKIELLKIGADDYMTKPFDLYELLARIEANLKRTVDNPYQNNNTLIYKNIKINNSLVYINGVLVPFTSTELSILELLLQYPQKIFSKQNLYESIWNEPYAYDDDTINTHISHIRKKIKSITNTLHKKLQVQIKQEEDQLKQSISNISHDLRTPLTSIQGYLTLLQECEDKQEQDQYIEIIKAKTDYLTDLVQEFYDLSVVENEQFDVECEKVDINRIVTDCLIEKYYEFGEIQPIIQTEKSPVWIYGNNLICKRIIENLITNAIRYSDNYIEVSINQEGVFMIKNSTQSLDEMDINLLFSKFYTVDKSRTKGGSGLGLYIVKELLKKIDGKIGNIEYNKPILSITLFFRLFK